MKRRSSEKLKRCRVKKSMFDRLTVSIKNTEERKLCKKKEEEEKKN